MNCKTIDQIFADTAYVRTSGTERELQCAKYLQAACERLGLASKLEPFSVKIYTEHLARLLVNGKEIPCKSYYGSPSGTVTAPLYYLTGTDEVSLKKCKGKIVLSDKGVGYKLYDKLIAYGALGFITYNGNIHFSDRDVDQKELTFDIGDQAPIPGVNIHVSDAVALVRDGKNGKNATLMLEQTSQLGTSYNLVLDLEGETDETVVITAHYDSTALSTGAYDNMSACIVLLALAERYSKTSHRRRIRLVWCGSEERGLLGSVAYCRQHRDELKNTVLNINLDMLGSLMGEFVAFSCVNEDMLYFLEDFFKKHRIAASARYAIRSSDSNSFVHFGVPAVSFARYAPSSIAPIHTRYDTVDTVSSKRLKEDIEIIAKFTDRISNEPQIPISLEISEKIRADVAEYVKRKKAF